MRKALRRIALSVLVVVASRPAGAQTAEDIIEKHLAATGGREALATLTSRTTTGTITITTPIGDLSGTIEVFAKAPNKSRTLIKLDLSAVGGGEVVSDQRFDGTSGYVIDTFNGNRDITGDQLAAMKGGGFPTPLLNFRDAGATIALTGTESVRDRPAYVLQMTPAAGPPVRMFFDSESFMLVRTAMTINVPQLGGDIEQVVDFSDFRDADGFTLPFMVRSANPVQTVVATTKEILHNTAIDDASFVRPPDQ
jgi:outer membrane lipoprotein-sorting protein